MFGNITHFNASNSTFNSATGDQYNTNGSPAPGLLGPQDPQWPRPAPYPDSSEGRPKQASAMFNNIDNLQSDESTFNQANGRQWNYKLSSGARAMASPPQWGMIPPPGPTIAPPAVLPPTPNSQPSADLTPQAAEARMFGNITHFESNNDTFNLSAGTQVNINYGKSFPERPSASGSSSQNPIAVAPVAPIAPIASIASIAPPEQKGKHHNNPFLKIKHSFQHQTPQLPPQPTPQPTPQPASGPAASEIETSYADIALTVGNGVFSILQSTASLSNLPGLQQAAGSVLAILQAVRGAKDNQDDFVRLANHACNLVSSVAITRNKRLKEGRELPPELIENLEILVGKLKPIEEFLRKAHTRQGMKGNLKRMVFHKVEAGAIQDHREKLTQALAEFGMRANIDIQDGVAQIDKRLDDLVEAMERIGLNVQDSSQPAQGPSRTSSSFSPDSHNGQDHYSPMGQLSPPSQAYPTTDPSRNYHTTHPSPFVGGFAFSPPGNVYNTVGGNQSNTVNHFNGSGGVNNFGNISGNNNNFGTITGGATYS